MSELRHNEDPGQGSSDYELLQAGEGAAERGIHVPATGIVGGDTPGGELKDDSVDTRHIVMDAVDEEAIRDAAVTQVKIALAAVDTSQLANAAVDNAKLQNLAVDAAKIADGSITTPKLGDAAVSNVKIADASVDTVKLGTDAVTSAKISDLAVDTAHINDAAIVNAKIASAAVGSAEIQDLAVDSAHINTAAVVNAKIANAAVDSAEIATAAITSAKIQDAAVGSAAIANLAVGNAHIQDAAVDSAKIGTAAITTAKIADLAVVDAKIDSLTADKIEAGTVWVGGRVTAGTVEVGQDVVSGWNGLALTSGVNDYFIQKPSTGDTLLRLTGPGGELLEFDTRGPHLKVENAIIKTDTSGERIEITQSVKDRIQVYNSEDTHVASIGGIGGTASRARYMSQSGHEFADMGGNLVGSGAGVEMGELRVGEGARIRGEFGSIGFGLKVEQATQCRGTLEISSNVQFGDPNHVEGREITDGYGFFGPGDLTGVEFIRSGSSDKLRLSANDVMEFSSDKGYIDLREDGSGDFVGFRAVSWTGIRIKRRSSGGLQVMNPSFSTFRQAEASAFNVNSDPAGKTDIVPYRADVITEVKAAAQREAVTTFRRVLDPDAGQEGRDELGFVATRLPEHVQVEMVLEYEDGDPSRTSTGFSLSSLCAWQQRAIEQLIDRVEALESAA